MTGEVLKKIGRRYLMSGLLVWLPILATVLVIRFILDLMDRTELLLPMSLRPQALFGINIPGFGAVLAVVVLIATGMLVSNFIGRSVMNLWEELLNRIPFVRAVYGGVKSFSTTILSNKGNSFKKVLLIRYPSENAWTIGFQTAEEIPIIDQHLSEPHVCVFIPTTPNPTSGFIVLIARSRAIELDISIDAALKMIVTLGVVVPAGTGTSGVFPAIVPPAPAP